MSSENPQRSIEELLHANPNLRINRSITGYLTSIDIVQGERVMMDIALEKFEIGGEQSLLISARYDAPPPVPLRNNRSYLRITDRQGVVTADHLTPPYEDIKAVSSSDMERLARATAEIFHVYTQLPESYKRAFVGIVYDEVPTRNEDVKRFNDTIRPEGQYDYTPSQAEYAYQVLSRPLPPIVSLPNVPRS